MRTLTRVAASALLLVAVIGATARAADFELGGRTLGERLDAALGDERFDCAGVSACFLMTACNHTDPARESVLGTPLDSLTLHYAGERVAAIEARFPSAAFDAMIAAKRGEHGEPESAQPDLVVWRQGTRVLRIERDFEASGQASLIISQQSFLGELVKAP
jgi:hypothetical protein